MFKRGIVVTLLMLAGTLAAVGLTGCGNDDGDADADAPEGGDSPPEYVVVARDNEFSVDELDVEAGEIVIEFNNQGSASHTFSIYEDEGYTELAESTGEVNGGVIQRFDMSLNAGEYFARCDVHPTQMTATVTAE